jgi:hypothetical protein
LESDVDGKVHIAPQQPPRRETAQRKRYPKEVPARATGISRRPATVERRRQEELPPRGEKAKIPPHVRRRKLY